MYVRAQVEVAMAGWTTEETRALLGLWGAADAHNRAPHVRRLIINVPRVRSKIHVLRMRMINISTLSNSHVYIWIVLQ